MPTLVMLGCVAVVIKPDNWFALTLVTAITLAALMLPDTVKLLNVPMLVIFGWFAVVSVPVKKFALIELPADIFAIDRLPPAIMLPDTVKSFPPKT